MTHSRIGSQKRVPNQNRESMNVVHASRRAARLAEYGIFVYEVRPGVIRTDMTAGVAGKYDALIENGLSPIARWGEPEDVAEAVSVLAAGRLRFSTGEVLNVDGGFHIPRL